MGDVASVANIFIDISEISNIWYVSNYGSDDNNCHSTSAPCGNLQAVLDRAADGADIYVTSDSLSMYDRNSTVVFEHRHGVYIEQKCCMVNSSLSYSIRRTNGGSFTVTCSGFYHLQRYILYMIYINTKLMLIMYQKCVLCLVIYLIMDKPYITP